MVATMGVVVLLSMSVVVDVPSPAATVLYVQAMQQSLV
jgi:hypothetical protein